MLRFIPDVFVRRPSPPRTMPVWRRGARIRPNAAIHRGDICHGSVEGSAQLGQRPGRAYRISMGDQTSDRLRRRAQRWFCEIWAAGRSGDWILSDRHSFAWQLGENVCVLPSSRIATANAYRRPAREPFGHEITGCSAVVPSMPRYPFREPGFVAQELATA